MRALLAAALLLAPAAAAQLPPLPIPLPENPLAGEQLVHRNADVEARLRAIAAAHPELAVVESAGQSTLGMDLWTITLQHPDATAAWRAYVDGGHHGNEYFGVELVMAYLDWLVAGYASDDPEAVAFLQAHAVKLLPLVNPEGNAADTRKNARQVDLNRNYPYEWGGEGSGANPTDGNYRGEAPLSEPESRANLEAALAFQPHAWVSMHTGIAEMYWPWSYSSEAPPDDAMFRALEAPFEAASNGRLDAKQSAELYLAAGSIEDTIYGEHGIPGFIIEVHEDQFTPLYPGGIPPEVADQLQGLKWLLANTARLGAHVVVQDFRVEGGTATVVLRNEGFGNASGVQLSFFRDGVPLNTLTLDVPAGGEFTARMQGAGDARGLEVEGRYPRLFIESTPQLVFTASPFGASDGSPGPQATPGAGLVLLAAAILLGARLGRR